MQLQFTASFSRGSNPNTAAKGTKVTEIFTTFHCSFKSRGILVWCMADGVVLLDVVFESKWPKPSIKVAASKFSSKSVANMAMGVLNKAILV